MKRFERSDRQGTAQYKKNPFYFVHRIITDQLFGVVGIERLVRYFEA